MGVMENREFSDMYYLYSLFGVFGYVLWLGDLGWLGEIWGWYFFVLYYFILIVDDMGFVYVMSMVDWLRLGMMGYNFEVLVFLYIVFFCLVILVSWLGCDVFFFWVVI